MQTRAIIGVLLILAGILFSTAGGFVLVQALDRQASLESQVQRSDTACRAQLVRLGRITPLPNNQIQIDIEETNDPDGLKDPRRTLADATAALAMCPNREIVSACLGTTCGSEVAGPIRMTLVLGVMK